MKINRSLVKFANNLFPKTIARIRYRIHFGHWPDLKKPKDINEIQMWEVFYADTTRWITLADKYAVREFVKKRGLSSILNPLIGKWDNPHSITWERMPNSFIFKCNNGGGGNSHIIIKDLRKEDFREIEKKLTLMLNQQKRPSNSEFHYKSIKPCIIAENLLINTKTDLEYSTSIIDYKFWCFNGEPYVIFVASNRTSHSCEFQLFDTDWNDISFNLVYNTTNHPKPKNRIPKPKKLSQMLSIARRLSIGFPVVRVDLYNIGDEIFFGELTFTSAANLMTYFTPEFCRTLGDKVDKEFLFSTKK